MAVYEIPTAWEPALPEEEIQKHVRSTLSSIRKRGLFHVTAQALFR